MRFPALKLFASLIVIFMSVAVCAQNRERFGISAKAGGVNAVTGKVSLRRGTQAPRALTSTDDLASGDVVATGADSQVEILLNPGTYFRLAENAEFVLVDNSLDNLLVKLNRGSAIIEATGPDGVQQHIPVVTDQQKFTIVRAGIYRINAAPGTTEVFVRKGRIALPGTPPTIVKSGKKITINGAASATAKLTKQDTDEFDDWSKERGKTLARANQKLSARALNGYLSTNLWGWPSSRFGRFGVWTWSPFASCYTFLPFYYGWGSPYGSSYGLFAGFGGLYPDGSCCRPRIYTYPPIIYPSYSGGNGSISSPTGGVTGSPAVSSPSGPSQPRPIDPATGTRSYHRIKDPN